VGLAAAGGAVTSFVALAFRRASGRGGESGATLVSALPSSKQVIREVNASLPIDRCSWLVARCWLRLLPLACSCPVVLAPIGALPLLSHPTRYPQYLQRALEVLAVQLCSCANPAHLTSPHRIGANPPITSFRLRSPASA
jgi:hypothetical protein